MNKTLIKSSSPRSGGKHHVWHVLNIYISHFADFQLYSWSGFAVHTLSNFASWNDIFKKRIVLSRVFREMEKSFSENANFRVNLFRQKKHFSETDWRKILWKKRNCHIYFFISRNFGIFFASFCKIHFRKKMQKFAKISWWSAKKNVHERFCSLLTLVPRDFQSGRRAQSKYVCNYLHDNIQDIH